MKFKLLTKLFNKKSAVTMTSVSETRRQEIDRILKQVNLDNFKNVQEIITQEQMDNLMMSYRSKQ